MFLQTDLQKGTDAVNVSVPFYALFFPASPMLFSLYCLVAPTSLRIAWTEPGYAPKVANFW